MNILIYEDWTHIIPTGKGWYTGFLELGHTVYQMPHKYPLTQIEELMDLIIHFDVPTYQGYENILRQFKAVQPDCKIIGLAGPYKSEFENYLGLIEFWCSMAYDFSLYRKDFNEAGFDHYDIPLATDRNQFFPIKGKKQYDFSFFGTFGHGYRGEDHYLYPLLRDDSLTRRIGGFTFDGVRWPAVLYEKLNKIYNTTKVNLNFHYDSQKQKNCNDFNGRMFDIPASGGFMLCDHPNAKEYLGDDVIVGEKENWAELIHYYKEHDDERKEAAAKLNRVVLEQHTYKNRMLLVLDLLKRTKIK